jgi:hypothetical protein
MESPNDIVPYPFLQKMNEWERQIGDISKKLGMKNLQPNKKESLKFHLGMLNQKIADTVSGFPS